MMDAGKVSDDEMLQDLQMLPQGGKQVCSDFLIIVLSRAYFNYK